MKKNPLCFTFFLCILLLTLSTTCFASATQTKRIAILPTINQTGHHEPQVELNAMQALQESLRIPLNAVLNIHEYIPLEEITAVLPELKQTEKLHKFGPNRLKEAAIELNADLIVVFVITDLTQTQHHNWDGDTIQYTAVSMQLLGYDKQKDTMINLKNHQYYHNDLSPAGSLEHVAKEVTDKLLSKADFKKDIFPLQK